ncbi:SAM-dependent methyltransferase [Eilatimonas milleporae]|uniref:Methyltransferase family protein n=1 Tax=Eilatimonas milleporae TaxID=911205 RepID=A0A3M0CYE7_9PROT|nr:methyltransferase domain-containing protein [Eilatimonas milleporae]RMB12646.1 methyltransferase family protein [Eilatimonas milleporae]
MGSKEKFDKDRVPLRLKLRAWWEGYDPDELQQRYAEYAARVRAAQEAGRAKLQAARREQEPEEALGASGHPDLPVDPWDAQKVNIAQYVWGEGFCGPGGPEYIIALSKLLALSPEMSMLQIGASLGGPARVLADRFGVWITGYEESLTLVEKGTQMSKMAGLEKKAALEHYNTRDFKGFDRKYDRAFAKEALFTIQDKRGMIEHIEDKLKPGGLFLMTDYVLGSDAALARDSYREWKMGERLKPYMATADEIVDMMKAVRMQVRVSEDISSSYVDMINQAWAGADIVATKLAKEKNGPQLVQVLMREAEFWTRRKKLLESGDLKLWRIVANKKSSGPSMMSDW